MFDKELYIHRRKMLKNKLQSGLLLFPGNDESPMNYPANTFHYRQDSNFLYFFGLDTPGLSAIIDIDNDKELIYGEDIDIDDIIWMGEQPSLKDRVARAGISEVWSFSSLARDIDAFLRKGRKISLLPPYRGETKILLSGLLQTSVEGLKEFVSPEFIRAVVSLREVKDDYEIQQIEYAVDIACRMHTTAMKMAFPGTWEREIAGMVEGVSLAHGQPVSFPVILSMDGQTLHNHNHDNLLKEGRLMVTDAGSESPLHYASDITRTVPVGGKFSQKQKDVYEIVLMANMETIGAVRPGIMNKELHMMAAEIIAGGLKDIGLMKGDVKEAVAAGAHALFFPHGLGHMMGLDVHDMEGLGENFVGYDETISRSNQFGLAYLRLAKELKPGFVFTIEPGIYFIPALIDLWRKENKFKDFIQYDKLDAYRDFGGIRVEDDVLVTKDSYKVLGKPIPKTVSEIEKTMLG